MILINNNKKRKGNFHIKLISGLIGSTISSFICSPLDLIKVRLQTGVNFIYIFFNIQFQQTFIFLNTLNKYFSK